MKERIISEESLRATIIGDLPAGWGVGSIGELFDVTTKWASCSSAGRLCFSRDLLRQADAFQEFVIVHELLHLRVANHGKLFKSLIRAYLPGWETFTNGVKCTRV